MSFLGFVLLVVLVYVMALLLQGPSIGIKGR